MIPRPLVVLGRRLWINPGGDAHMLRCVARTRQGRRCQNPVEYGQVLGCYEFQLGSAGYVMAYGSSGGAGAVDADRWLAQHCALHDTPGRHRRRAARAPPVRHRT
uniref:Putative membrane protein n=1 Tax=Streptomyces clavuligerus TaxID=1901 RepID=Q6TMQ8_STRCL|nr:putative membrane protein [Streptomyces clavuligerus]